jgi:hypothetical protein
MKFHPSCLALQPIMATPVPPQPAFTAFFDNVSKDPLDGTYSPLFAPFNISLTDANPTPNNHQQIAAASNQLSPLAIALLVNGLICVYCVPFRRNQAVGAAPIPALDGKSYAFDGKLVLGQGVLVEIPAQWFNMTAQVQVPTLNNIREQLAAHASPTLTLGPYAGCNLNTVAIKTRAAMVLPHKYVGLLLAQSDGIPPRYYFNTILPLLEADGTVGASVALTKYCQMTITIIAEGSPPCRLFPLPHLHVMSPSSCNPTSFSTTTSQPCWAPNHPLMISSHWLRTSPLTKMSRLFVRTWLGRRNNFLKIQ